MARDSWKDVLNYHDGHNVEWMRGGPEFFEELENLIKQAEKSIHFQFYLIDPDETGTPILNALKESGLINLVVVEESSYLSTEDLKEIEKLVRLHYELGINLEGIDVISNLLNQLEDLQQELTAAKNKLKFLGME